MDIASLIGNADLFPILKNWTFFNHGGVSPIPKYVGDAMRRFSMEAERGSYLATTWYREIESLRDVAAGLIHAHRDEIAFVKNTSEGMSIVSKGLEWQWGDRIITTAVEYPANIYPWMEVARSHGAQLVQVPEQTDSHGKRVVPVDAILKEAGHERTKLVALSHVEYASGQRHLLERIGNFCREHHKFFFVDAIQSVGVVPVDVQQMKIDFLSADGHKWMLAPEGSGLFYCRRELIERTRPLMIGWLNVVNPENSTNYDYTLKPDAGRFECGSYNVPGLLALKASLDIFKAVGIDAIANRIKLITDRLIEGLELKGWQVISPRGLGQWSGAVCFVSQVHNHEEVTRKLRRENRIEMAIRENRIRATPHFYNTEDQIDQLVAALPTH